MISRSIFLFTTLLLCACSFTQKIKTGADAFAVKQYAVAATMLQEEYETSERPEEKAQRAFLLGQSYEFMREPAQAAPWYRRAYDHHYGTTALEHHAEMLRQTEQYAAAIETYKELETATNDAQRYRGMITTCQQAMQWKDDEKLSPYHVQTSNFNSPAADYAPAVLGHDLILFTSDRSQSTGNTIYNWTGRNFSDLYTVNTSTGVVQPFEHVINTSANEGTVAFTSDRSEMYFTRCYADREFDSFCKLMMCRLRGASWSEPEVLQFTKEGINYGHPVITGHDSILIFSSNDPTGTGGYDLYYSQRTVNGWGTPVLLSNRINTIGNERFPSVYKDTLYFSSDYLPGLGGYDIFKTYLDAHGQWTPPFNLKPPVNSGWDDFGFVVDTFAKPQGDILEQGYFTSARNEGTGDDIFAYQKTRPVIASVPEVVEPQNPPRVSYQVYLVIKTMQPVFAVPDDPNSVRTGKKYYRRHRSS